MAPTHTRTHIIWQDCLESTNAAVKSMRESLDNLTAVATVCQTAGRGQGDHTWSSAPGLNLTFSMLLRFAPGQLPAREMQIINSVVTPALIGFLAGEDVEAWVKKPNDIWVKDKKIAGILIENVLDGKYVSDSVVGVGFNLNQTDWPSDLPNPVSLKQLTGRDYSPAAVLEDISERIAELYIKLFNTTI